MDIVRGCRQAEMPICFKKYTGGYKMKMFQISDKIDNVSRIGIGCMRITGLSDEKAVRSLTEGALECGINFFDHADIYAGGEAETVFGNALTPQLREKMVIQTKCAIRPGICYDFSKEYILNSVDGSLKLLDLLELTQKGFHLTNQHIHLLKRTSVGKRGIDVKHHLTLVTVKVTSIVYLLGEQT